MRPQVTLLLCDLRVDSRLLRHNRRSDQRGPGPREGVEVLEGAFPESSLSIFRNRLLPALGRKVPPHAQVRGDSPESQCSLLRFHEIG